MNGTWRTWALGVMMAIAAYLGKEAWQDMRDAHVQMAIDIKEIRSQLKACR